MCYLTWLNRASVIYVGLGVWVTSMSQVLCFLPLVVLDGVGAVGLSVHRTC